MVCIPYVQLKFFDQAPVKMIVFPYIGPSKMKNADAQSCIEMHVVNAKRFGSPPTETLINVLEATIPSLLRGYCPTTDCWYIQSSKIQELLQLLYKRSMPHINYLKNFRRKNNVRITLEDCILFTNPLFRHSRVVRNLETKEQIIVGYCDDIITDIEVNKKNQGVISTRKIYI